MRIRNPKYYLAVSVSLLTFLVYLSSLQNEFVDWDDGYYVFDNHHIRSFNLTFFKWAFFDFYAYNWHPLTWISHALDYAVWGLNPMGHHLTNNFFHAVNTYLVVLLVVKLLEAAKPFTIQDSRFTLITAGVTGLLFGLHPLHVESVAWVSERKDLLCAMFFLLSVMAYVRYATPPSPCGITPSPFYLKRGWRSRGRYLLSLAFFLLALLSKPMAISLPLVLLILDWYPIKRIQSVKSFRHVFVEKLPFIALSLILSMLTILAQKSGGGAITSTAFSPRTRFLVAAKSLIAYLWKMILPLNLSPYYPYPNDVSLLSPKYILPLVLVTGITMLCLGIAGRRRLWLSVWGYYILTLIPVLGIIQVGWQSMADRYTYLPSLGLFLIIGLLSAWAVGKINGLQRRALFVKFIGAATAVSLLFCLSYLSVRQIGVWKNSFTLWTYVIEKEPVRVPLAYNGRGDAFRKVGRLDKAMDDYNTAISLSPLYYETYYWRAVLFEIIGQPDNAARDYEKAITLNPRDYVSYNNLGLLYFKEGRFDQAIELFNKSIAIDPEYPYSHNNRGYSYLLNGQNGEALEDFNKTIELDNNFAMAYLNRGRLYLRTGNKERTISDFQKACALGNADGCNSLKAFGTENNQSK